MYLVVLKSNKGSFHSIHVTGNFAQSIKKNVPQRQSRNGTPGNIT